MDSWKLPMARELSKLIQVDVNGSWVDSGFLASPHFFPWLEHGQLAARKKASRRPLPRIHDPCATSPQTGSHSENHDTRRGVLEQAVLVLLRGGIGRVAESPKRGLTAVRDHRRCPPHPAYATKPTGWRPRPEPNQKSGPSRVGRCSAHRGTGCGDSPPRRDSGAGRQRQSSSLARP